MTTRAAMYLRVAAEGLWILVVSAYFSAVMGTRSSL
jgi:hypothetical protein